MLNVEGGALTCAACGSEWIHHVAVAVYSRAEDETARIVEMTDIDASEGEMSVTSDTGECGANPSARRGGIRVVFACEGCAALSDLTIAQHKGRTLVDMVAVTPPAMVTVGNLARAREAGPERLDAEIARLIGRQEP